MKLKLFLKQYYWYLRLSSEVKRLIVMVSPEKEFARCYRQSFHHEPDLKNPRDFVEKVGWMELHCDTSLWSRCTDKYAVRGFIEENGYGEYLTKLLGKWDDANDIDFNALPNEFVLKTNNGCETVYVVKDKSKENLKALRKKLNNWLKLPFGYYNAELHYTKIKPCIIAEEMLRQDEYDEMISPNSLIDYKIYSFSGKPECIWVAYDRTHAGVKMMLVDKDWNVMEKEMKLNSHYHYHPEIKVRKPQCLDKMLEIASKLSSYFPEVRVDFYVINDRPYIGELTFSSGYGFFTQEYYNYLGDLIKLPAKIK